ncbi:uncharacterized protein LOC134577520 isoform X1 [Pelobates fuscus]|uniref:uncharacterized protein LOC134577520 isoform X1 n=1 Tax=Pelobates fuscus TaxID=191477 RepID=UPI002FE47A4F
MRRVTPFGDCCSGETGFFVRINGFHLFTCYLQLDVTITIQEMSAQIPVTFCDVAASFTEDQWLRLDGWKKVFYQNVIKEIHEVLLTLGYTITNPDVIFNINKAKKPCVRIDSSSAERKCTPVGDTPDLLVRIKEETPEQTTCSDEKMGVKAYPVVGSDVSLNIREQATSEKCCLSTKAKPIAPILLKEEEDNRKRGKQSAVNVSTVSVEVQVPAMVKQEARLQEQLQSTGHGDTVNDEAGIGKTVPVVVKEEDADVVPTEIQSTSHSNTAIWPAVVKQEENVLFEEISLTGRSSTFNIVVKQEEVDYNEMQSTGHTNSTAKMLARLQNHSVEDTISEEHHNINTLRKTMSDIATIRTFLTELKEKRDIQNIPHQELDSLMSRFITAARRQDGRQYEPHTLRCMIGSLDRYLKMHKYPYNIRFGESRDFPLTRESLNVKQKILKKEGKGKPSKRPSVLTDEDIEHLYTSGILSMDNPTSLLNLILFNNGIHFGFRIREQYDLRWGDIMLLTDTAGNKYLEFNEHQTKTCSGENPANFKRVKPRIYSTLQIPSRDPVAAYIKYANSRPKSMMTPDSPFYLAPNVNYKPLHSRWFHSMKIGINKMRRLMKHMRYDSVLPRNKKLTYHSTWKTTVQKPMESHLQPPEKNQVSAHRSLQRINHYSSLTERKQHQRSGFLQTPSTSASSDRLPIQTMPNLFTSPFAVPSDSSDTMISKRNRLNAVIWENCLLRNSDVNLNVYNHTTPDSYKKRKREM